MMRAGINLPARRAALLLCAALLASFAVRSITAVRGKSATADEPLHLLGAYMRVNHADFRLNPEDPPLWGYWAMLAQPRGAIAVDTDSPIWNRLTDFMWDQSKWCTQTLYRTPTNDPDRILSRSRAMMLMLGVLLGALVSWWSWQLAGAVAALAACAVYCLDPSFLGHAPLVKNDVPIALSLALLTYAAWRVGQRITVGRAALLTGALAIALNVKFSAVLFVPILLAILTARVALPVPWEAMGRSLRNWPARAGAASAVLALCAAVSVAGIWACYGFRFAPTRDPEARLNVPAIATAVTWSRMVASDPQHRPPLPDVLARQPAPLPARLALWIERHKLLPQAWIAGFLDTYKTTLLGQSYLLGHYSKTGWWYYFPLAMLFKTPLATLAAAVVATAAMLWRLRLQPAQTHEHWWAALCLTIPCAIYGVAAMRSNLNLGLRHILPVYPLLFVLISLGLAELWNCRRRIAIVALAILAAALVAESLAAHPNYIAFFNAAAGGSRGGVHLLGDSNLDWGQDLKLLARWRRAHPDEKLYLAYFGMADPGYYVDFVALPGTSSSLTPAEEPAGPGVIAISATHLQGIYVDAAAQRRYRKLLAEQEPFEVLGGSIYLFRFDPTVRRW